jgi:hypothetical protein
LNHFVHYSTVTKDIVGKGTLTEGKERFSDEINEGVLIHAKTLVPNEAMGRVARCAYKMTMCSVGYECPDDLPFSDSTHQDGFLHGENKYCNCWVNRKVENVWVPKLEHALDDLPPF